MFAHSLGLVRPLHPIHLLALTHSRSLQSTINSILIHQFRLKCTQNKFGPFARIKPRLENEYITTAVAEIIF